MIRIEGLPTFIVLHLEASLDSGTVYWCQHCYYYYYYYYFNANERRFIARRKATPSSDHSRVRKSYRAGGVKIVTN
jgi:hypothetical protein